MTPELQQLLGAPRFKYLKISEITSEIARKRYEPGLVLLVEVVSLDISSSEIRQLVKEGRSIRYLVTDTVAAYMGQNRLYQPGRKLADTLR
jgi:nicotinic acid mononucleotide adenylyltransferase